MAAQAPLPENVSGAPPVEGQAGGAGGLAQESRPVEEKEIVATVHTYAKGRDVSYDVVVLKNGKVANMNLLVRHGPIHTRRMIKFGEIIGELNIDNSWNNRHAELTLKASDVLAVVHIEEKRGVSYELTYGDGELVVEYEDERDDDVLRTYKVLYYVHTDGKKYRLIEVDSHATPIIKIRHDGDRIVIRGNTFPIKDELKRIGARWNGYEWVLPANKADLLQQVDAIIEEEVQT